MHKTLVTYIIHCNITLSFQHYSQFLQYLIISKMPGYWPHPQWLLSQCETNKAWQCRGMHPNLLTGLKQTTNTLVSLAFLALIKINFMVCFDYNHIEYRMFSNTTNVVEQPCSPHNTTSHIHLPFSFSSVNFFKGKSVIQIF